MQRQNIVRIIKRALLTASRNVSSSFSVISEAARFPPVDLNAANNSDGMNFLDRGRVKADECEE